MLVNTTTGVLAGGGGAMEVLVIDDEVGIDDDTEDNMDTDIEDDEDDAEPDGAPVGKAVFKLLLPVGKIPDKRSEAEFEDPPPSTGGRDKPNKPPFSLVVSLSFGFSA